MDVSVVSRQSVSRNRYRFALRRLLGFGVLQLSPSSLVISPIQSVATKLVYDLLESRSRLALGSTENSLIQLYIQVRTDRGVYELCNERCRSVRRNVKLCFV